MITIDYVTRDTDSKYAISDSAAITLINEALRVHTFSKVIIVTSNKVVVTTLIQSIKDKRIEPEQTRLCVNGIENCAQYPKAQKPLSNLVRKCIEYKERTYNA